MRKLFLFVCFSFVLWSCPGGEVFAQSKTIDSLKTLLRNYAVPNPANDKKSALSDSVKVNLMCELSRQLIQEKYHTEAEQYAGEALALAQQINYKPGEARARNRIGHIAAQQDNFRKSLNEYRQALKIWIEVGDKSNIALTHNGIGYNYRMQGNLPGAAREHLTALKLFEEMGDKRGIADSYHHIGVIYKLQGDYDDALKEYIAALNIRKEIGDQHGIANSYNNIGNIYFEQGNYAQALKQHFASLKIRDETGDIFGIASSHTNIGNIYYKQANYEDALRESMAALKIYEELKSKTGIASSHIDIGNTYTGQKKYKEASEFLNKGLSLSKEIGVLTRIKDSYYGLSVLDSATGNFKQGWEHLQLYYKCRDSLFNTEKSEGIKQLQMQFDFDKKEQELKLLKNQKEIDRLNASRRLGLNFGLGGALMGVIGVAFGFYSLYKKTKKINANLQAAFKKLEDTQEQLIQSEKMAAFGVMASRLSHEIQNPLNFVNNFSELSTDLAKDIIKSTSEEEKKEAVNILVENLEKINQHGKRADSIIKQLQEHQRAGTSHEFFEDGETPAGK